MSQEIRRYSNGTTYTPVPAHKRKYGGHKYNGEAGEWFGTQWLTPLPLVPDEERRSVPETVDDREVGSHRFGCGCRPCERPEAGALKRKDRKRRRAQIAREES